MSYPNCMSGFETAFGNTKDFPLQFSAPVTSPEPGSRGLLRALPEGQDGAECGEGAADRGLLRFQSPAWQEIKDWEEWLEGDPGGRQTQTHLGHAAVTLHQTR